MSTLPPRPWRPLRVTDQLTKSDLYCLIERAAPVDGDVIIIEDHEGQRWRGRFRADVGLPFGHRIIAVSRAVIIPE